MARKKKNKHTSQTIFTRYMLVVAVFILWIGAIGVRLVYLQVNSHPEFRQQVLDQRQFVVESKMLRGTIFDRNGHPLAMSLEANSLYVDPMEIKDIDETSRVLGTALGMKANRLAKKIRSDKKRGRRFTWVKRKVDADTATIVTNEVIEARDPETGEKQFRGINWVQEQKRRYPYGPMAANVIGFANSEEKGQAGIELSLEKELRGESITTVKERDRLGRVYDEWGNERVSSNDVVLTLDSRIQEIVEEALAAGAKRANVKSGRAIVMNPKNGEILAMANYPSFNPNISRDITKQSWKNGAIQDNFPPGSIFKIITYGAALEENLIQPEGEIDCGNGTITIAQHKFNDSHPIGLVSYSRAFAESSNVGAIKTGLKVGKESFYKYAKEFGFGEPTGIQLPAETGGLLRAPKTWNRDSLASMSIGYEIGVSALQSATAFATIANDGVKIQPRIVKEIRNSKGEIVSATEPNGRQVVRKDTARKLRKMMEEVVDEGTAMKAQLLGYTSAGKTGTAWKYDAKMKAINRNRYVASFVGFAPANSPEIVVAVVMDEPRGALKYGGDVAAPVFKAIAENVLPVLDVIPNKSIEEPIDEAEDSADIEKGESKSTGSTPDVDERKAVNSKREGEPQQEKKKDQKKPSEKPKKKLDEKKNKGEKKRGKTGDLAQVLPLRRALLSDKTRIET